MNYGKSALESYCASLIVALCIPFLVLFLLIHWLQADDPTIAHIISNIWFIIPHVAIILTGPLFITVLSSKKGKMQVQASVNIELLRYILAFFMLNYGFSKISGKFFDVTYLTQDTKLGSVPGFELTWYYFGRSNFQELMIGILQFIPGALLLFRRTYFFSAILLFPITINVLVINVFNQISPITLSLSIVLVLANFYIIYFQKYSIVHFFKTNVKNDPKPLFGFSLKIFEKLFKAIVVGTIMFSMGMKVTTIIFPQIRDSASMNKFKGAFTLQQLCINDQNILSANADTTIYKTIYLEPQSRWNAVKKCGTLSLRAIKIFWHKNSDSIELFIRKYNGVEKDDIDSSSCFEGTLKKEKDMLQLHGISRGKVIWALYKKLPLRDFKWFW